MNHRVALVRCAEYEAQRVEESVRRAVDLLGGMARFVQPGQRVLVKPNLLLASDPESAIVTHPTVLRAVVRLVQEAGGRVLIADNPVVIPVTHRGWETLYRRTGCAAVAAETGVELNSSIVAQQLPHPDGRLIRIVDTSKFVTEADVIISLAKLKTHNFLRFTCAVKNLFGTVPGAVKFGYHVKLQAADHFADMLLDLVSFVQPALTIVDGIVGMDGDGPSAGRRFPAGLLLAGTDPVAVDVAALEIVGHDPLSVPTVAAAARRGWTTGRAADLELVGEPLSALAVSGFQLPAGGRSDADRVPRFLRPWATRQLVASPVISERCVGCQQCVESCPAQTIALVNNRARIELDNCIRCYCCHELCPEHAIDLHRPWLGKVMFSLGQ